MVTQSEGTTNVLALRNPLNIGIQDFAFVDVQLREFLCDEHVNAHASLRLVIAQHDIIAPLKIWWSKK